MTMGDGSTPGERSVDDRSADDELSDELLDAVVGGVSVDAALARAASIDPVLPGL